VATVDWRLGGRLKPILRRIIGAAALWASPVLALAAPAPDLAAWAPPAGSSNTAAFVVDTGGEAPSRTLRCLTEAVYYEAATEPRAGQEAVAQVVLNRLKRPEFPKTVCGVVFEGADRTSGCQFTFTCDGSLARRPVLRLWDSAEEVATAALNGYVATQVGEATHYHTVWVSPGWSSKLTTVGRIGAHVFYQISGRGGAVRASATLASPGSPPPTSRGKSAAQTDFSVWGLKVATLTKVRGAVVAREGAD